MISEVEKYIEPWRKRLTVKPGLTCYWQTLHNRNNKSFEDWFVLDLKYIEEQNPWVDFKIIVKTLWTVVAREGE